MNDDKINSTSNTGGSALQNQTSSTDTPQIISPVTTASVSSQGNVGVVNTSSNPQNPVPTGSNLAQSVVANNASNNPVQPASVPNTEAPVTPQEPPEEEKPNLLANMEGVKIAPAEEGPVNASNKSSAASALTRSSVLSEPIEEKKESDEKEEDKNNKKVDTSNTDSAILERPGVANNTVIIEEKKPVKKNSSFTLLFIVLILILGGYTYYSSTTHSAEIKKLQFNCSPVTASKKKIKLSLDSTLVKDLYSRVVTNIKEDVAQPEFNDNMKLYLAYRRIVDVDKYSSNCNLFNVSSMEPFVCEDVEGFVPRAFKEEKLTQAIHEMYGDASTLKPANIQLGRSCIGGYQYIPERGEFVQGTCKTQNSINYTVDKKLTEAYSYRNIVVLKEEVKYHANESISLPEYFQDGMYVYTFKLDMNYNYILLSKQYESKY